MSEKDSPRLHAGGRGAGKHHLSLGAPFSLPVDVLKFVLFLPSTDT